MAVFLLKYNLVSKIIRGSILCLLLCACSGCAREPIIRAEGFFSYHVDGVLVSAPSGEPIADADITVTYLPPDPNEISSRTKFVRTESDGAFSATCITGLAWGANINDRNPKPPPVPWKLRNIFIGVQRPDGRWHVHQIDLTAAMQKKAAPAERWINLGTIAISNNP